MGQWNRIESSEISPQLYDQWIFNSGAKIIQLGGDGLWNTLFSKYCWDDQIPTCKRMKLNPYLTPYTKTNSKCITDLNVRAKI